MIYTPLLYTGILTIADPKPEVSPEVETVIQNSGLLQGDGMVEFEGHHYHGSPYLADEEAFRYHLLPLAASLEGILRYVPESKDSCFLEIIKPFRLPSRANFTRVLRLADVDRNGYVTVTEAERLNQKYCTLAYNEKIKQQRIAKLKLKNNQKI